MNHRICYMVTAFLLMAVLVTGCQTAKKPEVEPKNQPKEQSNAATTLLSAAEKDPYNDGCVSCHKKEGDVDRSLPTYVERISGHPEVKETTVNACYDCHDPQKSSNLYKSFLRGMHKVHWESERFYGDQTGRCYSCHTVETNGVSGIKDYPPAGYREWVYKSNGGGAKTTTPKENNNQSTQPTEKSDSAEQSDEQNKDSSEGTNKSNEGSSTEGSTNGGSTNGDELPVPTP